ncbi:hypothetical protein LEP1GSC039_3125 [Leptospira santarosai str. 2000027870]|nr:hypothetical protein LEP1GSC039_3125 [Leptospira santarosai str. 2000027870]
MKSIVFFPGVLLVSVVSPILPTNRKFSIGFFDPYFLSSHITLR